MTAAFRVAATSATLALTLACESKFTPIPSRNGSSPTPALGGDSSRGSDTGGAGAAGYDAAGAGGATAIDASTVTFAGFGGQGNAGGYGGAGGAGGAAGGAFAGDGGQGGEAGAGGAGGAGGEGGSGPAQLTDAERREAMLDAHNELRSVVVATQALPDLSWSDELEEIAQDWADTLARECDEATSAFAIYHRPMGMYGENIASFLTRPDPPRSTPRLAVDGWASEELCWTFGSKSNSLGEGGTEQCDTQCLLDNEIQSPGCGHYTQLAWRDTTAVGCGLAHCEGPTSDGVWKWDIWVCNYSPPGNVIGSEPY